MQRIVFATGNAHKMEEIRAIMAGLPFEILSMKEAGIDMDVEETGTSFEENSLIKARAIHKLCGGIVLADDSGFEVDALDGAPGIYSARFMGKDTPQSLKNLEIVKRVDESGKPRKARFISVIAAVLPDGRELTAEGTLEGEVAKKPAGEGGFGYDPILYIPELGCTTAQLPEGGKNKISHRYKALTKMRVLLEKEL